MMDLLQAVLGLVIALVAFWMLVDSIRYRLTKR